MKSQVLTSKDSRLRTCSKVISLKKSSEEGEEGAQMMETVKEEAVVEVVGMEISEIKVN